MFTDVVISAYKRTQSLSALRDGPVALQIDVLVFERPPEPFHKDVVVGPSLAVHAEPGGASFPVEYPGELLRGVLASLIPNRFADGLLAKIRLPYQSIIAVR